MAEGPVVKLVVSQQWTSSELNVSPKISHCTSHAGSDEHRSCNFFPQEAVVVSYVFISLC